MDRAVTFSQQTTWIFIFIVSDVLVTNLTHIVHMVICYLLILFQGNSIKFCRTEKNVCHEKLDFKFTNFSISGCKRSGTGNVSKL